MEDRMPQASIDLKLGEITLNHKGGPGHDRSHLFWLFFVAWLLYAHLGDKPSLYEALIHGLMK